MGQRPGAQVERRSEPRFPRAFAFWVRPLDAAERTSAWMLDVSTRGAAFLTAAPESPPVGARIELLEMQTPDRVVREGAGPLPRFARVLRHDEANGVTQRVAVQFEADARAGTAVRPKRVATMKCPQVPKAPRLAPPGLLSQGAWHAGAIKRV